MAQIFGVVWSKNGHAPHSVATALSQLMRRPTQDAAVTWAGPASGLGALLSQEVGAFEVVESATGSYVVAIDGTPSLDDAPTIPAALVEAYHRDGAGFVSRLGGSFALAIYNASRRKLLLATDRLLTRFLFWTQVPGGFAFSSELKGLMGVPGFSPQLDPQAMACYLRFGRLFGRRSICRGVQPGLPGTTVEYDIPTGTVDEQVQVRLEPIIRQRAALTPERRERLKDAFHHAVVRGCPAAGQVGLSLSGGLDSRTILAVLANVHADAVLRTEGLEGCMDERVAARLADITQLPWDFQPLRQFDITGYVNGIRRYVYLTEGMMVPEGYPGIGALRFAVEKRLGVLLRGHGGENSRLGDAWPFQVHRHVLTMTRREELADCLRPESGDGVHPDHAALFTDPEMQRAVREPEDSYQGYAAGLDADLTPVEVLNLMYLRINDGGQVSSFRNCLRGYADMALPFLDDGYLDLVLGTNAPDRREEGIQYHVIRTHCPALMRVANSNHGAPMDASRLRRLVTEKAHAVLRKLRVPGFRHYHYVGRWMSEQLRDSVRSFLLEDRTMRRGLFNRPHLEQLLADPAADGRPRLLARLVMLESWLRLFVDGDMRNYQLSLQED